VTTVGALAGAARDVRAAWRPRSSAAVAAFALAAFAPLVFGTARTADLAGGLYLAAAAVGLALVVGVAGLPMLAQGGLVAVGAVVCARLLEHGVPLAPAVVCGGLAGALAGGVIGLAFARLPRVVFAAATWIVAWTLALGLQSLPWLVGGTQGLVVDANGPTPDQHYELALALTALAALGFAALARSPFGVALSAAREREPAACALGLPIARLRAQAIAAAGGVAGLAGALAVHLAAVADPAGYGPYLSFRLFVAVLIGGPLTALGAPLGMLVLGLLSLVADTIGSLEGVSAARTHTLLTSVLLLAVVSLGWEGILRPARRRRRGSSDEAPTRGQPGSLIATGLQKRYGEVDAARDVSLDVEPGTITALVGPNGSGKTTVLRMLAGVVPPDAGRVDRTGSVTRTLQGSGIFPALTPLEHVLAASTGRRRTAGFFRSLLQTPRFRTEETVFDAEARHVLARFDVLRDVPAGELPAGAQRRLMLATAYATGAPVLLVDEPTAGSSYDDARGMVALLAGLRSEGLALLVVEHNLPVVRTLADRVVVLDAGSVIADGPPDAVADNPDVRAAYLGRHHL
jgi:ABC-type branched-subunit amino acid transport system ATPase component/ABC-type branched-subunit amino acid transport system permease subunit